MPKLINRLSWNKWPLAVKLTLSMTFLVVLAVGSVTLLAIRREQQTFRSELHQQAELLLTTLAISAADPLYTLDADALSDMMEALGVQALGTDQQILASGRIYDSTGRIVGDAYDPLLAFSLEIDPFGQRLLNSDTTIFEWQPDQLVAGKTVVVAGQRLGAVSVGLPTATLETKLAAVRNQGLSVALVTVITGMLVALLLSRSITGPLQQLVKATKRIAEGDLTQKITIGRGDELAVLGAAMEQMRSELEQLYRGLERQVTERTAELTQTNRQLLQEIVQRERVEEALRESEERLRQVFSSISDHIYVTELTKDGEYINRYVSPTERLTGYPLETILADWNFWPSTLIHPDDQAIAATQAEQLAQGCNSEVEYRLVRADGQVIWVRDSGRVEKDAAQQSCIIYGIVSNITERKQAEVALKESEERIRLIIDTALDAVITMDAGGLITGWNARAETIFGWFRQEVIGRLLSATILPIQYRAAHEHGLQHFLATGEGPVLNKRIEITALHRDGHEFPIELAISPLRVAETFIFSAFIQDITERKQAEAALALARDQALESSRLKTELLAKVSHELRTPLGAILGFTEMLQLGVYGPVSPEQRQATAEIMDSTDYLTGIVNELLDQAQIEVGRVTLNTRLFAPAEMVKTTLTKLSVLAQAKGLTLATNIAPDMPPALAGDPDRLQQILVNLVSNAVKFTQTGTVQVRLDCLDSHWLMQVADTGPGIPLEAQGYIFEPFRQVDGSVTRVHTGTGLGLSIVKQLVTLMGGQVSLESEVGRGSTFTVQLPLQPILEKVA